MNDACPQSQTKQKGGEIVDHPETVAHQEPEDGDETKDAQAHVKEGEDLRSLV